MSEEPTWETGDKTMLRVCYVKVEVVVGYYSLKQYSGLDKVDGGERVVSRVEGLKALPKPKNQYRELIS